MATKELSKDELRSVLEKSGVLNERPGLALEILLGRSVFVDGRDGTEYALRGGLATSTITREMPGASAATKELAADAAERAIADYEARHPVSGSPRQSERSVAPPRRQEAPAADLDSASDDFLKSVRGAADTGHDFGDHTGPEAA